MLDRVAAETESLEAVVGRAARILASAGVDTPRVDARRLAMAATGLTAAELIARGREAIGSAASSRFDALVQRRCTREPVSRILGEREFYGRAFSLSPATLDPRPDSETLIDAALKIADESGGRARPWRILDIGTGTGCLLVTLLAEMQAATGIGSDTSVEALAVAAANAHRHGVGARAGFLCCDALDGVEGRFDLVVCNPPYIPTGEIAALAPEVRNFDPRGALDGGGDGLHIFRKIIPALERVVGCGWVVLEVGTGQADAVAGLLRKRIPKRRQGWLKTLQDLHGFQRCVAMEIQL
jgi:release factor glutamine methyltransferase